MSVRKRSWTTAKGEKKEAWVADYVEQAGRRHIKTFGKKKDAEAFHARANVEVWEGTHTANSTSKTVAEAAKLWLKTCEANGLERTTINSYRNHVDLHIVPYLGKRKLSALSAPLVRQFADDLRDGTAPGKGEGEKRSAVMVRRIIVSLGTLISDAQASGLVARNVVRDLRLRRNIGKDRQASKRQAGKLKIGVDIPSRTEIKAVVGKLEGRWRPILLTAIFTGLRSSELRGLQWSDVDLDRRELHVRQRIDRYNQMGAPKSSAGHRTIPLPPLVVTTLSEWKLNCPKGNIVFPTSTGNYLNHSNVVQRGLGPVQIKAGVVDADGKAKYPGLHSLRHFYASWLINRKADGGLELPLKTVQERMGHSTIAMTADRYSHLFPATDDCAEFAAAEQNLLG
jgi:integrase